MASTVPAGVSTFVGRERERTTLAGLIAVGRAITLTGPGGSGKTRLAAQVAHDAAAAFDDGPYWVELGGTHDRDMVVPVVATALGVRPGPSRHLADALLEHVGDRRLLIVVDNCEHLVESCSSLTARLLRGCPKLTVIATSRERLAVEGEVTLEVKPLALPRPDAGSIDEVLDADAARLFAVRARQARPDFEFSESDREAVIDICRGLDGLPLAIELAAARVRVLTVQQIAAGLSDRFRLLRGGDRDAPPRHRALVTSMEWSFDLLDDLEQLTLARLSVFADDFDLHAAEAVVADHGLPATSVLGLVTALAERSMLQVGEHRGRARYRLLETIRAFAAERLSDLDNPDRLRDRHLEHYVRLAGDAQAGLNGPDAAEWMSRLSADVDDLYAAMAWGASARGPEAVQNIVEPTMRFWFEVGLDPELHQSVRSALGSTSAGVTVGAGRLVAASLLAVRECEYPAAYSLATRAVTLARTVDDADSHAMGLVLGAWSGFASGAVNSATIRADVAEAVAVTERSDGGVDPATCAHVLLFAGRATLSGDSLDAGQRLLDRAIAVCDRADVAYHRGTAHALLSLWPLFSGDLDRAREHARQAVEHSRLLERHGFEVYGWASLGAAEMLVGAQPAALEHLARAREVLRSSSLEGTIYEAVFRQCESLTAYRFGDEQRARQLAEEARAMARARGSRWDEAANDWLLGVIALREGRPIDARLHLERCRDLSIDPHYPFQHGRALLGLAHLHRAGDDQEKAWDHAHEALTVLDRYGDRVGTVDALETIGGLTAASQRPDHCVRLLAAAEAFRDETSIGRFPIEADQFESDLAATTKRLGGDEMASHWAEGMALSVDEAVAYARRGRGERGRPNRGWQSLTPAELDAARLVATGCTNAEIGEQLFVSSNTVKKHLSSAYAKLGLNGRAELASEVSRRGV